MIRSVSQPSVLKANQPVSVAKNKKASSPNLNAPKTENVPTINIDAPPLSREPSDRALEASITKNEQLNFIVFSQWPKSQEELEDAPEIAILCKKSILQRKDKSNCLTKCCKLLKALCNKRGKAYGLANFKPITARTNNTLGYVKQRVINYSIPGDLSVSRTDSEMQPFFIDAKGNKIRSGSAEMAPTRFDSKNSTGSMEGGNKTEFLEEFYQVAYESLRHLRKGIQHYKEIILTLSFTRYAEYKLTRSEARLTLGKSIIGSCIWTVTCALKQLQEDPAVEQFEISEINAMAKPNSSNTRLLHDIASELLVLINLSFDMWNETVTAIGVLERIHLKTEDVFKKQTHYFHHRAPPNSEQGINASVHLKKYRRSEAETLELIKVDLRLAHHHHPSGRTLGYPRLLYKTNYTKPESMWCGFDPLPVNDKINYLKEVMKFMELVMESVKETVQKVVVQWQGSSTTTTIKPTSGVTSYESGIRKMEEFIDHNIANNKDWTMEETEEFFETDKIFLDDIDLATLGAAVTRTILHDARHSIHICYEISRLLNFKEFISLPEYDKAQKIFYKKRADDTRKQKREKSLHVRQKSIIRRPSVSFDIEEPPLDLRDLHSLFRNNPYDEIAKTLPIYCPGVGLTLQDIDLVFSPSSEKLLNDAVVRF